MIRLYNFYGHEKVKLGAEYEKIIRFILLTNRHIPELKIYYNTELLNLTF